MQEETVECVCRNVMQSIHKPMSVLMEVVVVVSVGGSGACGARQVGPLLLSQHVAQVAMGATASPTNTHIPHSFLADPTCYLPLLHFLFKL